MRAPKTVCKNGHEFTEANTYFRPDGRGRQCRRCNLDNVRRFHEARRFETLARRFGM